MYICDIHSEQISPIKYMNTANTERTKTQQTSRICNTRLLCKNALFTVHCYHSSYTLLTQTLLLLHSRTNWNLH